MNFDHAEVLGSCSSCHNNVQAQGKGPGHIDTSLECDACHSTMGWGGAVFSHAGIVTGCAACHNGVASTGMPPTHIPVDAAPCEACHIPTQYTSFNGATMNHPAVTPPMPCANCHEAGMNFMGVTMVTRPPPPHPASQDCGVCHLSTTSFSSGTLQPVGHIPTTQPCTLCHSNPSDFTVYAMRHDGISSGCAACHGAGLSFTNLSPPTLVEPPANHVPAGAAPCESCHSGNNFAAGGFAMPNLSGNSAPAMVHAAVAGLACESCHAQGMRWAGTPATAVEPVNHISIGATPCINCHSPAVFTSFLIPNAVPPMNHSGFTDNCSACHGAGKTDVGKSPKLTVTLPANHIPTGAAACEGCHSNSSFNAFSFVNASGMAPSAMVHSQVGTMTCSSCHEAGMSWIGAPPTVVRPLTKADGSAHVAIGECSTCHFNSVSFKGATDLPSNHIPLPAASATNCGSCHANLANFALYTMDHSVVTGESCASCHASGLAFANMAPPTLVQPPANHIAFGSAACDSCHSGSNFTVGGFRFTNASGNAPPAMVHAAVNGVACASCHASGLTFAGTPATKTLPVNHVPIGSAACEACHSAGNFTTFSFTNASGVSPPSMVHSFAGSTACTACHEAGRSWVGTPATLLRPATKADGTPHVVAGECSTCHFNTVSFKGATDLPSNHIPLPAADNNNCALCHSNPSDYSVAAMSHANISGNCAACHAAGKSFANLAPPTLVQPPTNHIAFGSAACESCHSSSNFAAGGFKFTNASGSAPPAMVHAAVSGMACASCHASGLTFAGTPATKTLPVNHVPVGAVACESCHSPGNFSSFAFSNAPGTTPPAMVHAQVTGTSCSTCHESGRSWIGAPATVLRPAVKADGTAHVATGECSTCHFNTTSFKGATDLPSNHIPLPAADNNNCALCHGNPNDYSVAAMNHTNIASGCATCHAAGKSFANMAPPVLVTPPANHIAFGSAACERCHSSSTFAAGGFKFTNASGSAPPAMVHAAVSGVACASCHASGLTFAGIPATKTLPANHVPVGSVACESCHTATNFTTFAFSNASGTSPPAMVHARVASTACSTCHEAGNSWIGTPLTLLRPATKANGTAHVPVGECSTCHLNTTSFKGATDLPSNHIPLPAADNNDCVLCHGNPSDYSVATMNHANIPNGCATCHAAGKSFTNMAPPTLVQPPANHIAFGSAACESCHSNSSFTAGGFKFTNASGSAPPAMVHAAVSGAACATCHASGMTFAGTPATKTLPVNHVPVGAAPCESCHSPGTFTTFAFTNTSGTSPPAMVHARVTSTACSTCHEAGNSWIGTPATLLRPATKTDGTPHVVAGECSTCHFNTVSFKGATDLPSNHIPLPAADNNNCALCHSNPNDYSVAAMNHVNISSGCSTCHAAGKSFANMAPPRLVLPPANHIAFGSAACESCHSSSNVAAGGFKFTNASGSAPPAMVHAAVSGAACATCHGAGLSFAGTPATRTLPPNHVPIGGAACESCHAPGNFTTFAFTNGSGTTPPAMVHAAIAGVACATCHGAGLTFIGTPATRTLPSNHVPVGSAACESCHAPSNFSSFAFTNASGTAPASMVHSVVAATPCSTCHETGKTWVGTPATLVRPKLKADGTAHVAAGECSTCHFNTTSFKGATDLPGNHIPLPAADNNNCALCHTTAANYSLATMNHVNIGSNCAQCHASGKSFANMAPPTLVLPPANHVPIGSAACENCHSKSSFATGGFKFNNASGTAPPAMVHAAVGSAACATCHASGLTFAGTPATKTLPANHVPIGAAPCTSCHAPGNFTSFAFSNASGTSPPAMVHAAVTGTTCSTCHAAGKTFVGTPATRTLPSNHVPVGSAACESCHAPSNFSSFAFTNASGTAPASMVHGVVAATPCSTCHEAGKTWVGTPATLVRPKLKADGTAHVAAGECSTCHFNTTSFKGATDLPANHIPLPAADANNCTLCHLTAGNYSLATMNHANISSNCAQCHAYGLSFANIAAPTLVQPPAGSTGHIPSNAPNGTAAIACEQCHLATVFTTFAGTVMKHAAVRAMTCMSCHELGMKWKTNTGVRLWVRDSANHHAGQDCGGSGCHTTRDKFAPRRAAATTAAAQRAAAANAARPAFSATAGMPGATGFSHRRVAGTSCSSCHGQASDSGKPPNHIRSSARCESCHMTTAWLPVMRVDHLQVSGSCASCHEGTTARGKPSSHIASGSNCEACHTTNAWSPARFDHAAIAGGNCRSCHDSVHATGKPSNHVPTTAQCDTCHGTLGWKPALLDHSRLTASCMSCHDNNIALGVPPEHFGSSRDCATCHSYPDWTPIHFIHTTAAWPGEHKAALACAACHTSSTEQIPWTSPANAGSCGGCHARDFRPDRHPKTSGGVNYTASELRDCRGACHVYTDATLAHVAKPNSGPYHRLTDASFKH